MSQNNLQKGTGSDLADEKKIRNKAYVDYRRYRCKKDLPNYSQEEERRLLEEFRKAEEKLPESQRLWKNWKELRF